MCTFSPLQTTFMCSSLKVDAQRESQRKTMGAYFSPSSLILLSFLFSSLWLSGMRYSMEAPNDKDADKEWT